MFRAMAKWALTRAFKFAGIPLRDPALVAMFGHGSDTQAGVPVDEYTALNMSAVWAAIRLLSESKAQLPIRIREKAGKDWVEVKDIPAYQVMVESPNPDMTPFVVQESMQAHALSWGNGYAEIVRDGSGNPIAAWPITPDRVTVETEKGRGKYFRVKPPHGEPGQEKIITNDNMFHLPGLGYDGYRGYSVVGMARESIALGLATEKHGASLFGNSALPSGVLEHPGELSKRAMDNLVKTFEDRHRGPHNAYRTAVLEEGMTWKATGLPPEDTQFLQTRHFQVIEICRWFNVPPHLLRELMHATFNNIEHQSLEFLMYSLGAWNTRWAQETKRKLIPRKDWSKYMVDHDVDYFLRTDIKQRNDAYRVGRYGGWLTANDIRTKEGQPRSTERAADELLVPTNMTLLGEKLYGDHQGANDISKSALTGAQLASLLAVVQQLVAGTVTAQTAEAMIKISFPHVTQAQITELISPYKDRTDTSIQEPANAGPQVQ